MSEIEIRESEQDQRIEKEMCKCKREIENEMGEMKMKIKRLEEKVLEMLSVMEEKERKRESERLEWGKNSREGKTKKLK